MRRSGGRAQVFGGAVVFLVGAALMSGCSPPDEIGLTADAKGRVSVENCGTYITAVRVTDAETGAPIWETRAIRGADGWFDGSGEVELGRAPVGWEEAGSAPSTRRPLRIAVEASGTDPRELSLNPPELAPGAVYYDGALRSGAFDDVCDPFYPYQGWVWPVLVVALLGLFGVVVIVSVIASRPSRPRGWEQASPPP